MKTRDLVVPLVFIAAVVGLPHTLSAMTITVDFAGECSPLTENTTSLKLTGRDGTAGSPLVCGHYTITPFDSAQGEARVDTGPDGNNDTLYLVNATVKKTSATATALHLTITTGPYSVLPDNVPPGSMGYRIFGNGCLRRGALGATGSSVRYQGWVDDAADGGNPHGLGSTPPTTTPTLITYTVAGAGCFNGPTDSTKVARSMWPPPNLGSPRNLEAELWVTLNQVNNDALNLTTLTIENGTFGCKKRDKRTHQCKDN